MVQVVFVEEPIAMRHFILVVLLAGAAWLPVSSARAAEAAPETVVRAFNQAISQRDLAGAEKLLAKGAVQFTLRSAHAGVPDSPTGITGDLKVHWNTIGPVLFSVTTAYRRTPDQLRSTVDGDLATVWAEVTTQTVERSGKQRQDQFSEVYLLVRLNGQWLIGAMADNRGTDKLPVAPTTGTAP